MTDMPPDQKKLARHALGFDNTTSKQSYRNRYMAPPGTTAHATWSQMCAQGWAIRGKTVGSKKKGNKLTGFVLTHEGAEKALEPGESLDPEDFPNMPRG